MDGREAMAFSGGKSSYYIHREGVSGSSGGFHAPPPGFRALSNTGIQAQSNVTRGDGGSSASTFSAVEPQFRPSFSHGGINIGGVSSGGVQPLTSSVENVKKKRGRPRKYAPTDGAVSLKLSPFSGTANSSTLSSTKPSEKRARGRPPGSGRKQQLASLGEWMNNSAGQAFSPHVISIGVGEDIVAKLLSLSQQKQRALCILSGTGTVSSVTLRHPASTNASKTFEGRFQILCLSGSYLVTEDGGPSDRKGGISASLSSPDGHVIGGGVAALIAGSPVQVVVSSFLYGGKMKTKQENVTKDDESSEPQHTNKLASPATQNYIPSSGMWHGPQSENVKSEQIHTGIDLRRG
ncbi:putative PPC domain, AT hook, DNA-binding protein [Lupinus albus]|uniref:AT-hook motif nuclear-localized protein n=1 Tax=Lupinus albus TaxID=3870 RepID=A0A6A4NYX7_LUPAL|nr:putative PPC domain, AT hook, DNA-binding protein [Lupinus albus]